MTAKEAYSRLLKGWGDVKVTKCIEYKDIFVFVFNGVAGSVAVDKKTGSINKFVPTTLPVEEFRSGVEVKNFK